VDRQVAAVHKEPRHPRNKVRSPLAQPAKGPCRLPRTYFIWKHGFAHGARHAVYVFRLAYHDALIKMPIEVPIGLPIGLPIQMPIQIGMPCCIQAQS